MHKKFGTSRKTELKLTNVARASLEELRLDYEDFLRQRDLPGLAHDHLTLMRFKARRCESLEEVREWVKEERQCSSLSEACLVANAALSLLNLCCYFLDRQLASQADAFEQEGGPKSTIKFSHNQYG